MTFLLYLANVLSASGQAALGKLSGRLHGSNTHYNLAKAIAAVLLFGIPASLGFRLHVPTLLYGTAYGVFFSVSTVAGLAALTSGPMALTSVITSFSLVIPCLYGILLLDETLTVTGGIGLALLACAIVLLRRRGSGRLTGKWWLCVLATTLSNGACSVVQKLHQARFPGEHQIMFMLFATSVMLLYLLGATVAGELHRSGQSRNTATAPLRVPLLLGAASGALNGAASYLSLRLAALENAVVLYPIQGAATAVTSFLIGRFFFRERVTCLQLLGLVLGIGAVVLLKL